MISYVAINNAIKTLSDFKRTLRPGCDIDRALGIAIRVLNEKKHEQPKKQPVKVEEKPNKS